MPAACRADVEALLRSRKLDRTLVPVGVAAMGLPAPPATMATGLPDLDRQLGGGFPLGQFSEVVGPRSSGRTSLLMHLLAAATARGELVALVDTFDVFDPASAAAAGVDVSLMLWVRGEACAPAFPLMASRQAGAERIIGRALKAFNLVLQSGMFGVMVLDLAEAPPTALRRVPMPTWLRFQRVLEGQEAIGLVLGHAPISRSAGGVTVSLAPSTGVNSGASSALRAGPSTGVDRETSPALRAGPGLWTDVSAGWRVFRGFESDVRTARARLVPGMTDTPMRLCASA